jgi:heme exporter protein D
VIASNYVAGAYVVFALVLGWDYLVPRLQLRRTLRAIAARTRRDAARRSTRDTTGA